MDEFKAFCRALVIFWDTGVFDERVMNLKYWYRTVRPRPPVFRARPYIDRSAKACVVCHKPAVPQSEFCRRHLKIRRRKGFCAAYREAMIKYWDEQAQGYLCRYTGIKLDEDDDHSPRYLNFDHLIPKGPVVVPAAAVINNMKSDLSEEEFRAIIRGLVRHWDGAEFNADLMRLKYWKR